jgi:DNA-directed RNA polymerase I, II, and III subunit RPABC5
MIIPIRCFTCGKVLADKYNYYVNEVAKEVDKQHTKPGGAPKKETKKAKEAALEVEKEAVATRHFNTLRTGEIMDKLGLTRYCCRRHMLSTVDMMEVI